MPGQVRDPHPTVRVCSEAVRHHQQPLTPRLPCQTAAVSHVGHDDKRRQCSRALTHGRGPGLCVPCTRVCARMAAHATWAAGVQGRRQSSCGDRQNARRARASAYLQHSSRVGINAQQRRALHGRRRGPRLRSRQGHADPPARAVGRVRGGVSHAVAAVRHPEAAIRRLADTCGERTAILSGSEPECRAFSSFRH